MTSSCSFCSSKWVEPVGLVEQYQMGQYMRYGNSRRKREKVQSLFVVIMAYNFPDLRKEMDIQIQEAQTPSKINRHTLRCYNQTAWSQRLLKEKWLITWREPLKQLSADFSAETLQTRKQQDDIFKEWKGKTVKSIVSGKYVLNSEE